MSGKALLNCALQCGQCMIVSSQHTVSTFQQSGFLSVTYVFSFTTATMPHARLQLFSICILIRGRIYGYNSLISITIYICIIYIRYTCYVLQHVDSTLCIVDMSDCPVSFLSIYCHSTLHWLLFHMYDTYLLSSSTYPMPNPSPHYYIQDTLSPTALVYKLYN